MPLLVIIVTSASLAILAVSTYYGWLAAIIAKPVIDIGWSPEYVLFGFSPLEIAGAAVPGLVLLRMIAFSSERPSRPPLRAAWIAYVATVVMGSFMYALNNDYIGGVSFFLRTLNGVLAFYSLQVLFGERSSFRALLIATLLAGLFPMLMGFYESVTGNYWRLRLGVGEQIRITGLYHNSTNLRYYAYATLTAIALYWVYFARRSLVTRLLLIGYAGISAVVLFKVFSKAGFATLGVAVLAWIVMGRRIAWPALLAVVILGVNAFLNNTVVEEVSVTFEKDIAVFEGEIDEGRGFGGRMMFWEKWWERFLEADAVYQLFGGTDRFGGRQARGGGHNDYIRALQQTGIIGLAVYAWLLLAAGLALWKNWARRRTPLNMMALVIFAAWMIETIGFTPAIYTNFQWYAWGFIGLALGGVRGLDPLPRMATRVRGNEPGAAQAPEEGDADDEEPGLVTWRKAPS